MEASNAKEMREALRTMIWWFEYAQKSGALRWLIDKDKVCRVLTNAKVALAAPPRNCDVGMAEEQKWRFLAVCKDKKHYDNVRECPLFVGPNCCYVDCFARWSQLPYEVAQEGDEKEAGANVPTIKTRED